MLKKLPLLLLSTMLVATGLWSQAELYHRVRVYTDGKSIAELAEAELELEHGYHKHGYSWESDLSEQELARVKALGFRTEIVINDVSNYYAHQNDGVNFRDKNFPKTACSGAVQSGSTPGYSTPDNWQLGSMGGYLTYQEILDNLDSMAAKYPNLITVRAAIDSNTRSIENRYIYYVKISDNPNQNELSEPKILYTSLHHVREPISASQMIYYMWYILENYSTDPGIRQLVDGVQQFFVPCVNPDGYLYNESTNPNGGGIWRKNRRLNAGGSIGVDLNRNYATGFAYNNTGSSGTATSDTYRGTAAFSEPETQNIRTLCLRHNFVIALNYHSYGNYYNYPYGYLQTLTPDQPTYQAFGNIVTRYNQYVQGNDQMTIGYSTNGSSDDWMYGEQVAKPKTFAATPEVGTNADGFWPPATRIVPLCKDVLWQNLSVANFLVNFGFAENNTSTSTNSLSSYIKFNLEKQGLGPGDLTVSIIPVNSAQFASIGAPKTYTGMQHLDTRADSIAVTLSSSLNNGDVVRFVILTDNGYRMVGDTFAIRYITGGAATTPIFTDNATNATNWTGTSRWGLTTETSYSPNSCFTDSPNANYRNNVSSTFTLNRTFDLRGATAAVANFWAKWDTEADYDFVAFEGSINGTTWTPICGNYTNAGTANQGTYETKPLYDGQQNAWVRETADLSPFLGEQTVRLRFYFKSDQGTAGVGFFFDDFEVATASPTGFGEQEGRTLTLFPNPTNGQFQVTGLLSGEQITVTDLLGRIILHTTATEESTSLNLSQHPSGVYFVKVGARTAKLVKQ